ncbi:MAG: UDP-N-acetylmuramoyl-L-alanyl-D-glutamate--2,6-diaminopimelate ligase [Pseudomonadota bacterium]
MGEIKNLSALGLTPTDGSDPEITGLSVDSRLVEPGHLFAALPGVNRHGGDFIEFAVRMDAAVILTDAEGLRIVGEKLGDCPVIVDENPRRALALAAARYYGAQPEHMVAVTGTNGKTSVANFARQIWEALGKSAVNFGTAGVEGTVSAPLSHTTPEPITLHRLLADLKAQRVSHAAMEASSHGLAQHRLDGVYLTAAAFTNFTQDHLDYHESFADYFDAKVGLFNRVLPPEGSAVLNIDDPKVAEVLEVAKTRGQDVITVGREADLSLLNARFDATGQDIRYSWKGEVGTARLELIGGFQAMNVLQAAALVIACGATPRAVFDTFAELRTVRGRMQLAATRANGAAVFVDYAHTPDAVETALKAIRPHVMGRLLCVLGAGGDRDPMKRPLMGKAASDFADVVFVTDDNPRTEEPALIRAAVLEGATGPAEVSEIGDRAEAILRAVDALQPGDTLLIAGKGHETGQDIGDQILPFDDAEQASIAVNALDGLGA